MTPKPGGRNFASTTNGARRPSRRTGHDDDSVPPDGVKEVLILLLSGVLATALCSRVYAAPLFDAAQTAAPVTAGAPGR
jgi:hypothetical protein